MGPHSLICNRGLCLSLRPTLPGVEAEPAASGWARQVLFSGSADLGCARMAGVLRPAEAVQRRSDGETPKEGRGREALPPSSCPLSLEKLSWASCPHILWDTSVTALISLFFLKLAWGNFGSLGPKLYQQESYLRHGRLASSCGFREKSFQDFHSYSSLLTPRLFQTPLLIRWTAEGRVITRMALEEMAVMSWAAYSVTFCDWNVMSWEDLWVLIFKEVLCDNSI